MSIFKSDHRDPRRFIAWLRGLLFGAICPSYLLEYKGARRKCHLRAGHKNKHTDGSGLHWGYGDNWLEMAE